MPKKRENRFRSVSVSYRHAAHFGLYFSRIRFQRHSTKEAVRFGIISVQKYYPDSALQVEEGQEKRAWIFTVQRQAPHVPLVASRNAGVKWPA